MNHSLSPLQSIQAIEHTMRQFATYESDECATWAELAFICLVRNIPCQYEAENLLFAGVPLDTPEEATRFVYELFAR